MTAWRYKAVCCSKGPLHNKGGEPTHNLALLNLKPSKTPENWVEFSDLVELRTVWIMTLGDANFANIILISIYLSLFVTKQPT